MLRTLCFAALLAFSFSCGRRPEVVSPAAAASNPIVAVVSPIRKPLNNSLTLVAEFRPYREIDLMAKVSGYVNKISVDMGDRVQTGQVLATIEIPEMADDMTRARASIQRSSAEASRTREEVHRAESAAEMAQLNFDRLESVNKTRPGLIAQQEIDNAKARWLEARAQLAAAKSAVNAAEQGIQVNRADESRVQTILNYTRVTAPFPGVITKRYAEIGSMVQAGTSSQTNVLPIVRLVQDSVLRLQLPIPESAVAHVRVGFPVEVHVATLNKVIAGKIARFSSQLQLSTRTMTAEIDVQNPVFEIKPGMFAEVVFQFAEKTDALVLPLMALDGTGETRRALVIGSSGKLEQRDVGIGLESAEYAEVLNGVSAGERVVLSGRGQLKPGQTVSGLMVAAPTAGSVNAGVKR